MMHMKSIIISQLIAFYCQISEARDFSRRKTGARIVNGEEVDPPGKYPWLIGLWFAEEDSNLYGHGCGASLIAPDVGLTAAHCYIKDLEMVAILNEHDFLDMDNGDAYFVTSTFIHPEYNATGLFENDMMLFQINKNVTLSKYMTLNDGILLPEGVTSEVTVAGWGTIASNSTSSSLLLETTVDLVSSETCDEYLGTTEHPGKICAYREGTDACQGDSGGPLFYYEDDISDYVQVGIVSYGFGCAEEDHPGIYSEISNYYTEIYDVVCADSTGWNRDAPMCGNTRPTDPPVVEEGSASEKTKVVCFLLVTTVATLLLL